MLTTLAGTKSTQHPSVAFRSGLQLTEYDERLIVRIQLLTNKERIKDHIDDSLSIGDTDLPSSTVSKFDTHKCPGKKSDDSEEQDSIGTRKSHNFVQPPIQHSCLSCPEIDNLGIRLLMLSIGGWKLSGSGSSSLSSSSDREEELCGLVHYGGFM
jgi:hypothetical protein